MKISEITVCYYINDDAADFELQICFYRIKVMSKGLEFNYFHKNVYNNQMCSRSFLSLMLYQIFIICNFKIAVSCVSLSLFHEQMDSYSDLTLDYKSILTVFERH